MKTCLLLFSFLLTIFLNAQNYYPLQVGDRWDYLKIHFDPNTLEVDSSYFIREITGDSLFSNGKNYFVISDYDLTSGKYIRGDSRFVYYYDNFQFEEDTIYRLGVQIGEMWSLQFGAIASVTFEAEDTIPLFSQMTIVKQYKLDGLFVNYVTLSDKFGPIFHIYPGEPPGTEYTYDILIGCVIDSVTFGNLVDVEDWNYNQFDFQLSQNYPNPFNPSTKIQYSVNSTQKVTLKVYDLLGDEIVTLVNEDKPAGTYEVTFDSHSGEVRNLPAGRQGLSSGIYFYQLKAGSFVETKKMVLLK